MLPKICSMTMTRICFVTQFKSFRRLKFKAHPEFVLLAACLDAGLAIGGSGGKLSSKIVVNHQ